MDVRLSDLAREILGYLDRHPDASDTLAGIARWWLLRQRIEMIARNVKGTVDELVEAGLIVRADRSQHEATYSMNKRKRRRIRSLLSRTDSAGRKTADAHKLKS